MLLLCSCTCVSIRAERRRVEVGLVRDGGLPALNSKELSDGVGRDRRSFPFGHEKLSVTFESQPGPRTEVPTDFRSGSETAETVTGGAWGPGGRVEREFGDLRIAFSARLASLCLELQSAYADSHCANRHVIWGSLVPDWFEWLVAVDVVDVDAGALLNKFARWYWGGLVVSYCCGARQQYRSAVGLDAFEGLVATVGEVGCRRPGGAEGLKVGIEVRWCWGWCTHSCPRAPRWVRQPLRLTRLIDDPIESLAVRCGR